MNKIDYVSLVLTDESSTLLKQAYLDRFIKPLWDGCEIKPFCHHMTIVFSTQINDEIMGWVYANEGKTFSMMVDKIGTSKLACAVQVKTDCPSMNHIKHITIATNLTNGGKPVDSNKIVNWFDANKKISLEGKVVIKYKK